MEEHIQDQNYDPPKEIPSSEVTHTGKAASLQEKGSSVKEDLPPRPASEYIPNNDSDRVSLASYKQKLDHASSYHEIDDGSYYDNELSFRSVAPVDVSVDKLSVDIDLRPSLYQSVINFVKGRNTKDIPKQKKILDDVSATMTSGTLTAILGASGSGKTTFLNILAHRMNSKRLQKTGTIRYNGNATLSSIRSAYVMQQDILLATLTARETLHYAAELRLPPPTTAAERRKIVDEVILELGLKECADTRIGDNEHKGCSGGEKRRTSLGVQLLANPSVLFLDEVTTGLDATSAHQLVRTLKQLARNGRTIITTIHQPRSEIWGLFDNLVLLTGGVPVYCGPAEKSLEYFEQQGYPIPPFVNPAEHLIELAAIDSRSPELESISTARVAGLKQTWKDKPLAIPVATEQTERPPEVNGSEHAPMRAGFLRQVRVQTARAFKTTYRDPLGMSGTLVEAALLAVLTGWIFFSLDGSLAGIRSREGALYIASGLQGYLILLFETYRLTLEIGLFDRERAENVVGVAAFLISRRLARFVTEDLPIPLIFSIIFYFMVGLRPIASEFLIFFSVLFLNQLLAVTIAMFCVALSRDFATASLIVNLNYTLQSMCSGFFVQSNQIPIWVRWLKYTAYGELYLHSTWY